MNNTEAFEAWYQKAYACFGQANFQLNSYGEYVDDDIEASWCAWQAALASQQDHIGDSNKLVNKVVFDSESARQFLIESVLPKFSDSTFQKYVLEELAGDFAYQLAMYLQSQAQQPTPDHLEVAKVALQKLACLGNGDTYGNSIGNQIAIDALMALTIPPAAQAQQESSLIDLMAKHGICVEFSHDQMIVMAYWCGNPDRIFRQYNIGNLAEAIKTCVTTVASALPPAPEGE